MALICKPFNFEVEVFYWNAKVFMYRFLFALCLAHHWAMLIEGHSLLVIPSPGLWLCIVGDSACITRGCSFLGLDLGVGQLVGDSSSWSL